MYNYVALFTANFIVFAVLFYVLNVFELEKKYYIRRCIFHCFVRVVFMESSLFIVRHVDSIAPWRLYKSSETFVNPFRLQVSELCRQVTLVILPVHDQNGFIVYDNSAIFQRTMQLMIFTDHDQFITTPKCENLSCIPEGSCPHCVYKT